ncbi:aldehyde dehydrogenase family protein (plasmid) [Citricoccus sp. SGAir0253]|uniref:aldehyde dehydrogenase family protein n=1 Tax=Citricoccus sp. SGAir0253 TaxID=2567881 RepID=UPI0011079253|nr:aldehyde dehydrogenase family protein [Citricoccus sp. SGAir0253]QCU79588.1 aldehyde dehydrogenase family protein [Citricoccus sp. SGAir0253]
MTTPTLFSPTGEAAADLRRYGSYIDGAWTTAEDRDLVDVTNPATEEAIAQVGVASVEDVDRAVLAARRAHDVDGWGQTTPAERKAVLVRFAEIMERRKHELVDLNIAECGSVRWFAEAGQVGGAIAHLRSTIDAMDTFDWERSSQVHFGNGIGQGQIVRESYGVAALISAYNFPLWLNMTKLAPALAAGCSVILKPATVTPLEGLILAEIGEEAGLPAGALNVIVGGRVPTQALTTHDGVDMVSFTGSDAVGSEIYQQAAASIKKVVLELGGKSANIVLEDADLDAVAAQVVTHTIIQAGQGCSLLMRTLVHRSRYDELVEKVAAGLAAVTVGDPTDPATQMGPLISAAQRDKVESLIADGVASGARLVTGGGRPARLDRGYFVEPTLFADVDNSMRIAREEIFGPVNVVIGFDTDDEAVSIANDSPYGLSGAVNTADPRRAYDIARRLRTGAVVLNGGGGAFPDISMPFGGYKASGIGREYGEWGLEEYLQTKSIGWAAAR